MKKELVFSTIKNIRTQVENIGVDDWKEVARQIADEELDFEVSGYRFIDQSIIDSVQQDELSSDLYILGCFNAWFLADVLGIPLSAIEAIQKAEAYEALGEMVISMGKLSDLQEAYVSVDGYGHHFAHYDGEEHEMEEQGEYSYYVFRVN